MKESLSGPVQANRSDGTKPCIGIERKNEPTIDLENGEIKVYFTFFFSPFSVAPNKTYILCKHVYKYLFIPIIFVSFFQYPDDILLPISFGNQ